MNFVPFRAAIFLYQIVAHIIVLMFHFVVFLFTTKYMRQSRQIAFNWIVACFRVLSSLLVPCLNFLRFLPAAQRSPYIIIALRRAKITINCLVLPDIQIHYFLGWQPVMLKANRKKGST